MNNPLLPCVAVLDEPTGKYSGSPAGASVTCGIWCSAGMRWFAGKFCPHVGLEF